MKLVLAILVFSVNALAVEVIELKGIDHHLEIVNELENKMKKAELSLQKNDLLIRASIDELTYGAETNAEGIGKANIVIKQLTDSLSLHPISFSENIWEDYEYNNCNVKMNDGENIIERLISKVNSLCSKIYDNSSCQSNREQVTLYRENQIGNKDVCFGVVQSKIDLINNPMITSLEKMVRELKMAKDFFLSKNLSSGNSKLQKVYDSLLNLQGSLNN